uniref:Galectin domain-containing protein n=1 Tax=Meloidogyne hapla TaxID=6305 RepID=A0A1I8B4V7_MELHA
MDYGTPLCPKMNRIFCIFNQQINQGNKFKMKLELMENINKNPNIFLLHVWDINDWANYVDKIIDEELNILNNKPTKNMEKYSNGLMYNITLFLNESKLQIKSIGKNKPNKVNVNLSEETIKYLKNDKIFELEIYQHNYSIEIWLNNKKIVKEFWPFNWWEKTRINGIDPPPKNNISRFEKELEGKELIIIRGIIPKNPKNMIISFLSNSEEKVEINRKDGKLKIGEIIFEIFADFGANKSSKIEFRTIRDDFTFGRKKAHETTEKIKINEYFELRIKIPKCEILEKFKENYEIEFNYDDVGSLNILKHDIPYFKLNRIVPNDETDYSIPIKYLNYNNGQNNGGGLLLPGDHLIIKGNIPKNAKEFSINFCYLQKNCMFTDELEGHIINKHAKIGENILNIRFVFDYKGLKNKKLKNKIILKYCSLAECKNEHSHINNKILPGNSFIIKIDITHENFNIFVQSGDKNIGKIEYKSERNPSFADHIQVYGDVSISRQNGIIREWKYRDNYLKQLKMPYAKKFNRQIDEGDLIRIKAKIKGTLPTNKVLFSVGIHHNSIGKEVSKILLKIAISQSAERKINGFIFQNYVNINFYCR